MMGTATFYQQPTSEMVRAFLGRTIRTAKATPKYIICDRGPQFDCHGFRRWCRRHGIRPRFGAVGQHGSIAVVERLIHTLKQSCTRLLTLVPLRATGFIEISFTSAAGTTSRGRTRRWLAKRPMKSTIADSPPYASRGMNHVPVGPAGRRLPDRGHWCAASLANDWNCMSSSSPAESTCRS